MTGDGNRNADAAQGEVVAFLADPESYRSGLETVTRIDTHAAMVFLAGRHAYKIKRAVRFAYGRPRPARHRPRQQYPR
jgi:aminoglycoside phosphotransferase family enzyme